jgi:hypothetical protein
MFGENRFRYDGAETAGTNQPQNRREEVDCEDDQMPHEQILAVRNPLNFGVIWNSPWTGFRVR